MESDCALRGFGIHVCGSADEGENRRQCVKAGASRGICVERMVLAVSCLELPHSPQGRTARRNSHGGATLY